MELNRYSTSSRFTSTTTPPPPSKKERIAAQKAKNLKMQQEYFGKMDERDKIIEGNEKIKAQYEGDLSAYEKLKKEDPGALQKNRSYELLGGKGIPLSDEGLKRYQEMERKEGRPIPYKVERGVATITGDPLDTEEDFFKETLRGRGMAGTQSYYKRPVEPKYQSYSMPKAPTPVTEEMELKDVPRLRSEEREMIGTDRSPYKDPNKPGKGSTLVKRGFKGDKIKYEKGRPNLVERAKTGGDAARYRREERLAKATYGRGLEQMTGTELSERKANLKERKREQMKGGNFFKNLAVNQEARKEIRDINRAQKYSKMVGGSDTYSVSDRVSKGILTDNQKKSGPKYFKPETMKNYRSSDDNPLNRNSSSRFFK